MSTETVGTSAAGAGTAAGVSLPLPVFDYGDPRAFFRQFRRYSSLKALSGVVARDLICFAIGSCKRAAWIADRVEAEVVAGELAATVTAAEEKVLQLLTPEVLKGQILQGLDQRRLQQGETPREYVEALKIQLRQVMPELTAESLDRMTIVQAIKGAPDAWSHKLGEGDLSSLDQLVTHMTLLQGKQKTAARRCQESDNASSNRKCYSCGLPGHVAKQCKGGKRKQGSSSSRGIKCFKCGGFGHIAKQCASGGASGGAHGGASGGASAGGAGTGHVTANRRVVVGSTVHLDVTICGVLVRGAVVDSGSERTLLSKETAEQCQLSLRGSRKSVVGAGRERLTVHGATDVVLQVPGTAGEVCMEVLVADCGDTVLLGTDFLKAAEVAVDFSSGLLSCFGQQVESSPATVCRCVVNGTDDWESQLDGEVMPFLGQVKGGNPDLSHLLSDEQKELKAVLEQSDVFSVDGQLGCVSAVEHRIELKETPQKKKPYPVPPALRETVDQQIADMLAKGVIRECSSPYASPVLLVKKGRSEVSGKVRYRFCTDFRELNRCTVKDSFPLPRIESLLASIGPKSRVFTQLDQKAAYWQVKLEESSQEKTAFITDQGQYCYQTLAFGLCNGPATYQRMMTTVLKDLLHKSVVVYLDDLLIFTETVEQHIAVLKEVFKRLERSGIRLNPEKCRFAQSEAGLRSRSRSRSESVVFPGVGVGVDKVYRLRRTPGKLLFPIHSNRHADYFGIFAHIFVVD